MIVRMFRNAIRRGKGAPDEVKREGLINNIFVQIAVWQGNSRSLNEDGKAR